MSSISKAIEKRFQPQSSRRNCPICGIDTEFTEESSLISCGTILIIQIERFSRSQGRSIRNTHCVDCHVTKSGILVPPNRLPTTPSDSEISFSNSYSLVATINHTGSLDYGHYTAYIKDSDTGSWLFCNDKSVSNCKTTDVNNVSSYVLFFVRS